MPEGALTCDAACRLMSYALIGPCLAVLYIAIELCAFCFFFKKMFFFYSLMTEIIFIRCSLYFDKAD